MATRFGLTWWGRRWIAALEALGAAYANRLPRGRTYARRGTVTGLHVTAGAVTAAVWGSRAEPYRVSIRLPAFDEGTWAGIVALLASELRHVAALLDGQMPPDVDDVLTQLGLSLFPQPGELTTSCSCPDWANPCKHVAAVHYVLAQTFDGDPFLLPALRGWDRERLLAGLRAARSGALPLDEREQEDAGGIPIASLSAATLWEAPADLAEVTARPEPPVDTSTTLRRLGPPPGCAARECTILERLVADAAEGAWRLASYPSSTLHRRG